MDKIKETIEMLQMLKDAAEPIQTPDSGCGYSTLIKDVKCDDSFTWVIEETIVLLNEFQKINTQRIVKIKENTPKEDLAKLQELLRGNQVLAVVPEVEIVPLNDIYKETMLGENNGAVDIFLSFDIKEGPAITFADNSTSSRWKMKMTEDQEKQFAQRLINFIGGAQ